MSYVKMHKRKCGTPRKGLYAISDVGSGGRHLPFTALAAPIPGEIRNPRAAEKVHFCATASMGIGLVPPDPSFGDNRIGNVPNLALADLWGMSQGYTTVWDVIEETQSIGVARRIPNVPNVPLPCPLLMMHMQTQIGPLTWDDWQGRLNRCGFVTDTTLHEKIPGAPGFQIFGLESQPWLTAVSLGRVGDDDYMWHPYPQFWRAFGAMTPKARTAIRREGDFHLNQGVFGLTWITNFVYVLGKDEDTVPEQYAERGVLPAVAPDDPRARD